MQKFLAILILAGLSLPVVIGAAEPSYKLPETKFEDLINKIANVLFAIIVIISVLFLLYGGFLILTAAGAADQIDKGRSVLLYAVIGLVIAALAKALQTFIIDYLLK